MKFIRPVYSKIYDSNRKARLRLRRRRRRTFFSNPVNGWSPSVKMSFCTTWKIISWTTKRRVTRFSVICVSRSSPVSRLLKFTTKTFIRSFSLRVLFNIGSFFSKSCTRRRRTFLHHRISSNVTRRYTNWIITRRVDRRTFCHRRHRHHHGTTRITNDNVRVSAMINYESFANISIWTIRRVTNRSRWCHRKVS